MPHTQENLHKHELIGLKAKVIQSPDPNKKNTEGKVKNETRDTLNINGKKIPKLNHKFKFWLPNGETKEIKGKVIQKRPEDRIKK